MEYYSGFLVPVKVGADVQQRPCKDTRRAKRSLQKDIGNLQMRLKSIEGKLMQSRQQLQPSQKRNVDCSPQTQRKVQYRVIENEYHDYNMQSENEKLRDENRLLNQYFEVFSKKYRLNQLELEQLRQENDKLRLLMGKGDLQMDTSPDCQDYSRHGQSQPNFNTTANISKFVYYRPPYLERSDFIQQGRTPKGGLLKCSDMMTKANYDDSSVDFPRTERSALKSARSGLL